MGSAFGRFCMQFCCCCCITDEEDDDEKEPLLPPDPLEYFNREVQKRRDEETNLWSTPGDPSHSERNDDRTLYTLLQARNQTRMGSTGYRRLSVDIEAMRDTRREVREKWKTILENLGFMAEADSLLNVSAGGSQDRMRDATATRAMLNMLHTETSIFNSQKEPPPERYLFIIDRLIYLDIAEDFVAKAKRFYPPKDGDSDDDPMGLGINLPLLLARMNGARGGGGEDDEEEDESDASDRS